MNLKSISIWIASIAASTFIATTAANAADIFYVNKTIDVYRAPNGLELTSWKISEGDMISQGRCENGWCFIGRASNNYQRGWIKRTNLSATPIVLPGSSALSEFNIKLIAKNALNIRFGPSRDAQLLGEIPLNEVFYSRECQSGYCYMVRENGQQGWVLESATKRAAFSAGGIEARPADLIEIDAAPMQLLTKPEVCFFEHINYGGNRLCFDTDAYRANLADTPPWNDYISSVRINGNFTLSYCRHSELRGECQSQDKSAPQLGIFNDQISSLVVYLHQ